MRNVKGFQAEDGAFFEDEKEAELYEARQALVAKLYQLRVDRNKFCSLVEQLWSETERYINAYKATHSAEGREVPDAAADAAFESNNPAEVDVSPIDHALAEESPASLLELSVGRPGGVSNVGRRSRTEEVQDRRAVDGSGGGGVDASDVRGDQDMATSERPRIEGSRGGDGDQDIREEKVGKVFESNDRRE